MSDIYISYAWKDRDLISTVLRTLTKNGIPASKEDTFKQPLFADGETDLRKTIKNRIESSSIVVIVDSKHSRQSQWVNYEAGMAAALGKPIVVVGRKGSRKPNSFPFLGRARWLELDRT